MKNIKVCIWKTQLLVSCICICAIASTASGQTTYFVDDSISVSGIGTSWATAKKTIQEAAALAQSNNQDIIKVGQGTYRPLNQFHSILLKDRIRIEGGYAGYGASDPDARNPATFVTILSGDFGGGTHAEHVVSVPAQTGPPTGGNISIPIHLRVNLDGVTITGGVSPDEGGGILIASASTARPVFRNCIITDNYADTVGGGFLAGTDSQPVFRNCKFIGNSTLGQGGAGYSGFASVQFLNCTFDSNFAQATGGALSSYRATHVTAVSCTFKDNICGEVGIHEGTGGAIFCLWIGHSDP